MAAALMLVLVMGGACGKTSKGRSEPAAKSSGTTTTEAGRAAHTHPKPTLVDPKTGKQGRIDEHDKYTASSPPPAVFRAPDIVGAKGDVPLEVKVTPACVEHGQTLVAVMKSEPGMTVVAQIKWPNDQFSGLDSTRGTTGPDGLLRWEVVVKPTAVWGQADLQAAAIDESKEGSTRSGTTGSWEFVVAPPGRC